MKTFNIAVIGECMVELQKKQDGLKQSFGGDTLNTALYLSRLTTSHGIKTSYITALGTDPFSKDMLANWRNENIDTSLIVQLDDKQPGLYYIETDDTGERKFHYWRSDSAAKYMFDGSDTPTLMDKLFLYQAVYLSGITLAILTDTGRAVLFGFLETFKKQGGKVFFDNNYRPKLWNNPQDAIDCYAKILSLTDTALLTFDDEQELYGDNDIEQCIERTSKAGVKTIVIKRGSQDCIVVEGKNRQYVAPLSIDAKSIIDTTAAGDSFSAGFLAKHFCGGSAQEASFAGHCLAGNVIQHSGAIIPSNAMPDLSL